MPWILRGIGTDIVSLAAGLRNSDGGAIGVPWWMAGAAAIAAGAYIAGFVQAIRQRSLAPAALRSLFPGLALVTVFGLLTIGGGFSGPPSVRYVFCFYALVALMLADGFARLIRWNRLAGGALVVLAVGTFGFGEIQWWRNLHPDGSSAEIVHCLDQHSRRLAMADYWIAYPLTFISEERVLVVPENAAEDRYAPYRRQVEAAADRVRIVATTTGDNAAGGAVSCRTSRLRVE
jgi:hypothetical protein